MSETKPNIIIVMSDQQRADLRKSCGYPLDTMPFLDSMGREGVDFDEAYTPNPTCMPARVSMFTGRYSQTHRVRTNHNAEDAWYNKDLLEVLKENGYITALCGKNHSHHKLEDFDFCETCGHLGYEGEVNNTPQEVAFADFLCTTKHMETDRPSPYGAQVQHPARNVTSALKFMDGHKDGSPFFMWVSFAEPHNPYQVPEPYFNMFPPEELPEITSSSADLKEKGERFEWLEREWDQLLEPDREARLKRSRSNYLGMLRLIDDQLKRLVEGVSERGLDDRTIILYVSDHGDFVGEYGLLRKGADLSYPLIHVPCVWKGPGIAPQGKRGDAFVNLVDIFPTVCDLLGIEVPFGVQGKSLRPLLENKDVPEREFDCAYSESGFGGLYWTREDGLSVEEEGALTKEGVFDCLNTWTQSGQVRSLCMGGYRIQVDMMGKGYLYHYKKDPAELRNLWDEPSCRDVKEKLLAELTAAMLRACDPLPAPRRRYKTKTDPQGYWFRESAAGKSAEQ